MSPLHVTVVSAPRSRLRCSPPSPTPAARYTRTSPHSSPLSGPRSGSQRGCGCGGWSTERLVLAAEHEVTTTQIRDEALALGQLGRAALEMMRSVFAQELRQFPGLREADSVDDLVNSFFELKGAG